MSSVSQTPVTPCCCHADTSVFVTAVLVVCAIEQATVLFAEHVSDTPLSSPHTLPSSQSSPHGSHCLHHLPKEAHTIRTCTNMYVAPSLPSVPNLFHPSPAISKLLPFLLHVHAAFLALLHIQAAVKPSPEEAAANGGDITVSWHPYGFVIPLKCAEVNKTLVEDTVPLLMCMGYQSTFSVYRQLITGLSPS